MITVAILINNKPLFTRTASNVTGEFYKKENGLKGLNVYQLDTKELIWHDPKEGAVVLAKKMLDTVYDMGRREE